jgi:hypothetical protein
MNAISLSLRLLEDIKIEYQIIMILIPVSFFE